MVILREKGPVFDIPAIYQDSLLAITAVRNNRKFEAAVPKEVEDGIKRGEFDTDPEHFYESLQVAINHINGSYLASRSLASLKTKLVFKVPGYNAGFALSKMRGASGFCEGIALHNRSGFQKLGKLLMGQLVKKGGKYLECFGDFLCNYYKRFGFEVYKELPDTKMPDGKKETLYFMKLRSAPALS